MPMSSIETAKCRYILYGLDVGFVASSKGLGDWDEERGYDLSLLSRSVLNAFFAGHS